MGKKNKAFFTKKNLKWIIPVGLVLVVILVFVIMGMSQGKKTNPDDLEKKAIDITTELAQKQIDKITSEPGYTGHVEIDKYYGMLFKSYNFSADKRVVYIRYQLSRNEYSQHVGNDKLYNVVVFYKGDVIATKDGELKISNSDIKAFSNEEYSKIGAN